MINLLLAALLSAPASAAAAPKDPYKTDDERIVYSLGRALARNVAPFNLSSAELKILQDGVRDQVLGKPSVVDFDSYAPRINDLLRTRMALVAEKEKAAGKAFAEAFAKEPGVQPVPGGGWIKHVSEGKGGSPTSADTVKIHYHGTLIDGTVFDSSVKRGEPIEAPLSGGLIACWLKGVPLMKKGGKARLVCPSEVAYGDDGRPPHIKGGSTLVFDLELLDFEKTKG